MLQDVIISVNTCVRSFIAVAVFLVSVMFRIITNLQTKFTKSYAAPITNKYPERIY